MRRNFTKYVFAFSLLATLILPMTCVFIYSEVDTPVAFQCNDEEQDSSYQFEIEDCGIFDYDFSTCNVDSSYQVTLAYNVIYLDRILIENVAPPPELS